MSSFTLSDSIFDKHGYLKDHLKWNQKLAIQIAQQEGIELTEDHWKVIECLRRFYKEFKSVPGMRALVNSLNTLYFDSKKANSKFLYELFPKGPALQGSRIAGLPKPVRCM